jgi:flagellar secretion chaperone FliS
MGSYNKNASITAYANAAATASKTTQVVMLYDGLVKIIQQAKQAIIDKKFEDRYNLIERACMIVAGLQGCLDFEKGGEVSQLLNDYYSAIEVRLILIQGNNDLALCDQIVKELKIMRDSWAKVDKKASNGGGEEKEEGSGGTPEAEDGAGPATLSVHTVEKLAGISVSA